MAPAPAPVQIDQPGHATIGPLQLQEHVQLAAPAHCVVEPDTMKAVPDRLTLAYPIVVLVPASSVATVVAPLHALPMPNCAFGAPTAYVPAVSSRVQANVRSVASMYTAPEAALTTTRTHDHAVSWRADTVQIAVFGA